METKVTPIFSIVLATHNRPDFLKRALESALSQSLSDFEIIVVDDGSTLDNSHVMSEFELDNIKYIKNEKSLGVSGARNVGIENAKGKYICFLDDDDAFHPAFLERSKEVIEKTDDSIGFTFSGVMKMFSDENGKLIRSEKSDHHTPYSQEEIVNVASRIGASHGFCVKRECIEKVGGFDTNLRKGEDTDFTLKLMDNGFMPTVVPDPLMFLHKHHLPHLSVNDSQRLEICELLLSRYEAFFRRYSMAWVELASFTQSLHQEQGNKERADYYEKLISERGVTRNMALANVGCS